MHEQISVILPVYNREAYIEECLQSILHQCYENLEIIIIDDGSTDRSLEICKNLAILDPRIKIYSGMHQGVSAARNIGLEAAQGEYVFFADSDDIIHPELLQSLVTSMKNHKADMGGTQCRPARAATWSAAKEKFLADASTAITEWVQNLDCINAIFSGTTPLNMIGGVMISREYIGDTKFRTDLTIGEDFYFIYENLIKGANVVFLEQRWYLNRIHDSNTSWDYGYTGFMTRYLRRELIWKSETAFGRIQNAKKQKSEIYSIYLRCVKNIGIFHNDAKKMRKFLKANRKELLGGMRFKLRAAFIGILYFPAITGLLSKK